MKVISFSVWGNEQLYLQGALTNAELAPSIYPGWRCRFHIARDLNSDYVHTLKAYEHVDIVQIDEDASTRGLFWRFAPAMDSSVEVVLIRDTDSRLSMREQAAVDQWLQSGRPLHIMRDHPEHWAPILAGMWGVRDAAAADLVATWPQWLAQRDLEWEADQEFLREVIYPAFRYRCLCHDSFFDGHPFPAPREGLDFVGQVYDEHDRPQVDAAESLRHGLKRRWKSRLRFLLRPAWPRARR